MALRGVDSGPWRRALWAAARNLALWRLASWGAGLALAGALVDRAASAAGAVWMARLQGCTGGALAALAVVGAALRLWQMWHLERALRRRPLLVAQLAEAALPALAGKLTNALALAAAEPADAAARRAAAALAAEQQGPRAEAPPATRALTDLYLAQQAAALAQHDPAVAVGAWQRRRLRSSRLAATVAVLLATAAWTTRASRPPAPAWGQDLHISYGYPAYLNLPARVDEAADGDIVAPAGTEVAVTFTPQTLATPTLAEICAPSPASAGCQPLPLTAAPDGRLTARLSLTSDGSYTLRRANRRAVGQDSHRIRALIDRPPEARFEAPSSPHRQPPDRPVNIVWSASDDHGITAVTLLARLLPTAAGSAADGSPAIAPSPVRVPLAYAAGARARGRLAWMPPAALLQDPEATVELAIEVQDNDGLAGPKTATSAAVLVRFDGRPAAAARREAQVIAWRDRLVDWLASELTGPVGGAAGAATAAHQAIAEHIATALQHGQALVDGAGAAADPIWTRILGHSGQALDLRRRALAAAAGPAALASLSQAAQGALREDILLLADRARAGGLQRARAAAGGLRSGSASLRQQLDTWAKASSPGARDDALAAVRAEAEALGARLAALAGQMAGLGEGRIQDAANPDAGAGNAAQGALGRLQAALEAGDAAAAAAEVAALQDMADGLARGLDDSASQLADGRYRPAAAALRSLAERAQRLETQQREVLQEQGKLAQRGAERAAAAGGETLSAMLARLGAQLASARAALGAAPSPDASSASAGAGAGAAALGWGEDPWRQARAQVDAELRTTEGLLAAASVADAQATLATPLGLLRHWRQQARPAHVALPQVQAVADALDRLLRAAEQASRAGAAALQSAQRALAEEAGGLGQALDDPSSPAHPFLGPAAAGRARRAQAEMAAAAHAMGRGQPEAARQSADAAMPPLRQLAESLGQSTRGGGMPLPAATEAGGEEGGQEGHDGAGGADASEGVALPVAGQEGLPKFRRDVLEATRQPAPRDFEESVRRYYETLLR